MLILVQCPIVGETRVELAPPLGLLRLSAQSAIPVAIVDLNLLWAVESDSRRLNWPESAVQDILVHSPKVVGFTSMAVDAAVVLRLAGLLKQADPNLKIIVGGPYFGSIPAYFLEHFPVLDAVVTGEAEYTISDLYMSLSKGEIPRGIPGVSYRDGSSIVVGPPSRIVDVEQLGLIDYTPVEIDKYWAANPNRMVDIEFSRGCKYRCSFCYTTSHFGKSVRQVSPGLAADLLEQAQSIGAYSAFVVGDNFLNDRMWALEVCAEIEQRKLSINWTCYATVPDLDEQIAMALGKAGCTQVYIGVDAVGIEQQKSFRKKFFSGWSTVRDRLQELTGCGVEPTAAFILNGLGDTRLETESNLQAALDVTVREIAVPRLNVLADYPGTAMAKTSGAGQQIVSALKIDLLQDVPEPTGQNEFAFSHPEIFPFHTIHRDPNRGFNLILLSFDMTYILRSLPYTAHRLLLHLIDEDSSNTPLVDWWESFLFPRIPENQNWFARQMQLEQAMEDVLETQGPAEVRATFELETGGRTLASGSGGQMVDYVVGGERRQVMTRRSIRISEDASSLASSAENMKQPDTESVPSTASPREQQISWRLFLKDLSENGRIELSSIAVDEKLFLSDTGASGGEYPKPGTELTLAEFRRYVDSGLMEWDG
ncbi:MAG: B12-binding domain-containing radical SAM protein [Calditrichaeota bacterium]|nr:B12-binding domain-containing radical SAM protein [Calditrichota bacterium]